MTKPQTTSTTSISSSTKVQEFLEAADALRLFKERHKRVFEELAQLAEVYNQTLEDAEKEVRSLNTSVGPFAVVGTQSTVDADKLFDELGMEDFQRVGGTVSFRRVLDVDKTVFETYAKSGAVHKDVLEVCYKKKNRYNVPKKIELP